MRPVAPGTACLQARRREAFPAAPCTAEPPAPQAADDHRHLCVQRLEAHEARLQRRRRSQKEPEGLKRSPKESAGSRRAHLGHRRPARPAAAHHRADEQPACRALEPLDARQARERIRAPRRHRAPPPRPPHRARTERQHAATFHLVGELPQRMRRPMVADVPQQPPRVPSDLRHGKRAVQPAVERACERLASPAAQGRLPLGRHLRRLRPGEERPPPCRIEQEGCGALLRLLRRELDPPASGCRGGAGGEVQASHGDRRRPPTFAP